MPPRWLRCLLDDFPRTNSWFSKNIISFYHKHKILEKRFSDGLKWKSCFSWKLWVNIVKTDVFDTLVRKPHKEIFSMASFSTGGIGLNGHMGSTFSKRVGLWKVEISKIKIKIVRKCVEMGSEKWSGGFERSRKIKIALRIHWKASRTSKTLLKIQKRSKTKII